MSRRHEEIWWMICEQLVRIADSLAVLVVALSSDDSSSDISSSEIKDDEDKDSPELA